MEVFFIVNEQAGSGKGQKVWSKLKDQLDFTYKSYMTEYQGHATIIANDIAKRQTSACLIIAVGGDGTVHEVVKGAAGNMHIQISAIKAGSGNDFTRGYKVFQTIKELNQYIAKHQKKGNLMDLGHITLGSAQSSFVNNAGIGFDAYVTTKVNQSRTKKLLNKLGLGRVAYLLITISALLSFKRFQAVIECNGQMHTFNKVWFIAICNQPYFGGGMKISPRSKTDDQHLELVVVYGLSAIKLLLIFASVYWGKHEQMKHIRFFKDSSYRIKVANETVSHVDGEWLANIQAGETIQTQLDERKWLIA